jgi:hypothetical protein
LKTCAECEHNQVPARADSGLLISLFITRIIKIGRMKLVETSLHKHILLELDVV